MERPKSRTGESMPCDYCNEQIAVIYCRADSAKLCLLCDHHVHSANALSRKHLRSQICDNCASEPVSARCSTDNLLLCHDCDCDAHATSSVSVAHRRLPVDAFSGCPSALDLASAWGIDLDDKKPQPAPNWTYQDANVPFDSWMYKSASGFTLQELMVPSGNAMMYSNAATCGEMVDVSKRQNPSCGKQKQVIFRQLMELFRRESAGVDGDGDATGGRIGENLVPGTPNQSGWQGNAESGGLGNGVDGVMDYVNQSLQQQQEEEESPFSSLLLMQTHVDLKDGDRIAEGNTLWDTNSNGRGSQVLFLNPSTCWSFNCFNFFSCLFKWCCSVPFLCSCCLSLFSVPLILFSTCICNVFPGLK